MKRRTAWAKELWKIFQYVCPNAAEHHDEVGTVSIEAGRNGGRATRVTKVAATYTRSLYTLDIELGDFLSENDGDDGLEINKCQPKGKNDYRGYAMLFNDPYFRRPGNGKFDFTQQWAIAPVNAKRDLEDLHPDTIGVIDGNTTRPATDEELLRDFGITRCEDKTCSKERGRPELAAAEFFNGAVGQEAEEAPPSARPATNVLAATSSKSVVEPSPSVAVSPERSQLTVKVAERIASPRIV